MVSKYEQQQQLHAELEVSSSSWETNNKNSNSNSHSNSHKRNKIEESDEDLFTVPDVETRQAMDSVMSNMNGNQTSNNPEIQNQKRRQGRNPVDKEYRRLKRLLRNRVSAQQARERKKVYVNDLELRAKELHDSNSKLEEKISTLINENTVLRKILMNTRPKVDEGTEQKQKQDRLSKS